MHNSPRTWFLTQALSPLAVRLTRQLLAHGDYVVACLPPLEIEHSGRSAEFRELADECRDAQRKDREGWKERFRGIRCDGRQMGQCTAAVAEAVQVFGRIDILLCCKSDAVVGTVEELSPESESGGGAAAQNLVRDQFETIFFSQVNFLRAVLPQFRAQHTGHAMVLSSIGGHIGTPGMPVHTAATWALEGYCDSLAYEIAPFNIKVTIVQPSMEVQMLTNRIVFAPKLGGTGEPGGFGTGPRPGAGAGAGAGPGPGPASGLGLGLGPLLAPTPAPAPTYGSEYFDDDCDDDDNDDNLAADTIPSIRDMLTNVLDAQADGGRGSADTMQPADQNDTKTNTHIVARYPQLPAAALDQLVLETVHALTAIGGHENPPARHIVGFEASTAVQEKLKTISEELEDFVEAGLAVDIFDSELQKEAREGRRAPAQARERAPSWQAPWAGGGGGDAMY